MKIQMDHYFGNKLRNNSDHQIVDFKEPVIKEFLMKTLKVEGNLIDSLMAMTFSINKQPHQFLIDGWNCKIKDGCLLFCTKDNEHVRLELAA